MRCSYYKKILIDVDALDRFCEKIRNEGKTIVLVNGTFDLVHPGHIYLLNEASKYGDVLVVLLNSDSSIKKLKGEDRPVFCEQDRKMIIGSLECVDYVYVFDSPRITTYLDIIKPKVWVKGSDYIGRVEESEYEKAKKLKIEIKYVDRGKYMYSSSELLSGFL